VYIKEIKEEPVNTHSRLHIRIWDKKTQRYLHPSYSDIYLDCEGNLVQDGWGMSAPKDRDRYKIIKIY
jgi:hypothetical protein